MSTPSPSRVATPEKAASLYSSGLSIRKVADTLGVSQGVAQTLLRRSGTVLRTKSEARKGFAPSPESIEKMRATKRGTTQTPESNAKRSATLKGVPKSADFVRHMSLTRRGKNNPNYNPALTEEDRKRGRRYVPGYLNWIKDVYARDSFKCVLCGSSRKLNAHHLDSWADFPKKRLEIANGVTLCKHHHDEFHSQYGRKHARKPKFEEFASSYKDDK